MLMTSLGTKYWQFILAQGLCMGLGMTCLFVPCVAVLPPYFFTRRSRAMGIAPSGSSIGAIVFTILFQQLEPQIGFGWTTPIIAFVLLPTLILPMVAMRKRVPQYPRRIGIDMAAFKEAPFVFMLCPMFFLFTGLYIPYYYIEVFSIQTRALARSERYLNKYLIVFLNVGSAIGRLLPNIVADKIASWNTMVPVSLTTGVIGLTWVSVNAKGGLIAFWVFYCFVSGSVVALVPIIWAIVSPNPKLMGTRISMATVPMATGLLIGNPIAGALLANTSFIGLQVFCGCTVATGGMFLLLGRIAQGRLGYSIKV